MVTEQEQRLPKPRFLGDKEYRLWNDVERYRIILDTYSGKNHLPLNPSLRSALIDFSGDLLHRFENLCLYSKYNEELRDEVLKQKSRLDRLLAWEDRLKCTQEILKETEK